jgi:hypothetical protein
MFCISSSGMFISSSISIELQTYHHPGARREILWARLNTGY